MAMIKPQLQYYQNELEMLGYINHPVISSVQSTKPPKHPNVLHSSLSLNLVNEMYEMITKSAKDLSDSGNTLSHSAGAVMSMMLTVNRALIEYTKTLEKRIEELEKLNVKG